MPVLTIRVSDKEKSQIVRRARKAGLTTGALVRELIAEPPFVTAAELLAEMESMMGDQRLRIKPRK